MKILVAGGVRPEFSEGCVEEALARALGLQSGPAATS
jgi:hypothetical protein